MIYKATNKINNKFYIGQAVNLKRRIAKHKRFYKELKSKFYSAIICYGWNNFIWEIIDTANSKEELNQKEINYIKKFNTIENGYNLRPGGMGGGCSGKDNYRYKELDELKIIDLYLNKDMTATAISKLMNVNKITIIRRLNKNNIKTNKIKNRLKINEEQIIDLYINKKFSIRKIAKTIGYSRSTITKRLLDSNLTI